MTFRLIFAAVLLVGFQPNVVRASNRLKIDTTLDSNIDGQAARIVESFANGEGQAAAAEFLLKDLSSAETTMRIAAMNITTSVALHIIDKHQKGASEIDALIRHQSGQKQPGYAGVQKGQDMLNEMIKEAQEKLDLERQTCSTFIKSQTHTIWLTVQDIRMFDARAAKARENVLSAQTEIQRLTELLPKLTETLVAHNRKCALDITELEAQLKIVLGDIEVMSAVLKMTECKTSLLMSHASKISSVDTNQLMKASLSQACDEGSGDEIPPEQSSWDTPEGESLVQLTANPTEVSKPKQRAKCTLSKGSCKKLRDKFLQIQGGIQGKRDELLAELLAMRKHCTDEKMNLESQISDAETDLKSWQTALAKATKEQNDAERNSKIKNEERIALIKELVRMLKLCKVNINNLISEGCALGKIRGELEKMKGHTNPAFLQDCEVTDWSADECSVTCAGGTQKLNRAISVHPVGGAECPPLEMSRKCNEDECPVDCEVSDWSEWGDCSSECNGGVKQKIRNVVSVAQNGGQACGETSVADSCNVQRCDVDCVLGDWTGWSKCSKECDGGLRSRIKHVIEAEKGAGECAKHDDDIRLEYMPCSEQDCKATLSCESQLDIVLLLDGSGSLREAGWKQSVKFTEMFIAALKGGEDNVKLSVILFSGPRTWDLAERCTGASVGPTPKMEDCGIQIVQHFTADMKKASDIVKGLAWPAATTLTSQALMAAKSELSLGRKDAQSVVVVVTDGRPMNKGRTGEAAKTLREGARLMWVPVTQFAPMADIRHWASTPISENIVQLNDFYSMTDPESIGMIISNMCPKVNQTDCWTALKCPSGMNKVSDGSACADSTGKTCDLGYCDGKPSVGVESCSTGPVSKENLIGNGLGDKCWNRFPCPADTVRRQDGSVCEKTSDDTRCDLAYCNNVANPDLEACSTGPDVPTTTPTP